MKLQAMVGCKLFKEIDENTVDILRIMNVKKYKDGGNPAEIIIRHEDTGVVEKMRVDSLSDYSPLEPDALLNFSIVNIRDREGKILKDVIITVSKIMEIKMGRVLPFAVCRQNITDVFHNIVVKDESEMIVGLAINQNNCPANYDYAIMLACDEIVYTESINFYRNDTLKDIIPFIKKHKFDEVLEKLYTEHVHHVKDMTLLFKKQHQGWCKDLETLLKENAFQTDINEMFGITDVQFDLTKHLTTRTLSNDIEITITTDPLKEWLSSIYKINMKEISVIEFDHDINMADFNDVRYFLLRDINNRLFIMVFTSEGEYLESDLELEANKKDFSTEFRINFYNKYNHIK